MGHQDLRLSRMPGPIGQVRAAVKQCSTAKRQAQLIAIGSPRSRRAGILESLKEIAAISLLTFENPPHYFSKIEL
jgi:hypothetical protein